MRWLTVFVVLVTGCSEPTDVPVPVPTAAATARAPRAEDCLVDGRSLEFQVAVAVLLRSEIKGLPAFPTRTQAATLRADSYVAEVLFMNGSKVELQVYAIGNIDAETCAADVESWELY